MDAVAVTKSGRISVGITSPTGYNITGSPKDNVQVYIKPTPESAWEYSMSSDGDSIEFIPVEGTLYEVHTYKTVTTKKGLIFNRKPNKVDVLVVGGGGGGAAGPSTTGSDILSPNFVGDYGGTVGAGISSDINGKSVTYAEGGAGG